MKRTRRPRKLELKREAIRQLGRIDLDRAGGAGPPRVAADTEAATCPWTHLAAATATAVCGG